MLSRSKVLLSSSALFLFAAGSAYAQDTFEWNNGASDQLWSNAGNWSVNGGAAIRYPGDPTVPGSDDDLVVIPQTGANPIVDTGSQATPIIVARITIPASDSVTLTFQNSVALTAGSLQLNQSSSLVFSQSSGSSDFKADSIESTGTNAAMTIGDGVSVTNEELVVNASTGLTLVGTIKTRTVDVLDGVLVLGSGAGTTSVTIESALNLRDEALLFVNADSTLRGNGLLEGFHPYPVVTVAAGQTLTLEIPAFGTMQFAGSGTLANRSVVTADTGTISFGASLNLDDGPTSDTLRWRARWGHQMEFFKQHTGGATLAGRFKVDTGGSIYLDQSITTLGQFVRPVGSNDVNYGSCPGPPIVSGAAGVIFNWDGLGATLCAF